MYHFFTVTISTSTYFDGLLVTGLYTSTSVQASQSIGGSNAFGFGKSIMIVMNGIANSLVSETARLLVD